MTQLGGFVLLAALVASGYAAWAAFWGGRRGRASLVRSAERALVVTFGLLSIAVVGLVSAFVSHDFGVEYVASYSSRDLPLAYTIAALWAGQKGSLLLWAWLLSGFSGLVIWQNRWKNRALMPYVSAVLAAVLVFFEFLLVFVSPPFARLPGIPPDGSGLNPMLQNPGMVFHPTTLYLGYVGFTVPFAFAIAALVTGQLGDEWIRTTRRWTLFAWFFLTLGNLFGAQWAYVELGWGGFWMWDPVESASLMPWLTGTAFLHSVMIQEKKGMLKVWNMVLIIVTFALTLFGTFLTRSGVISSVHTFSESSLGPLFLGFIGVVLAVSIGLLMSRLRDLRGRNELDAVVSRESTFLLNNLLFVGAAFAVFWGTVFPLISEAVRGTKITVGAPFFNQVNIPIFLGLLALSGICPLIAWRRASLANLRRNFTWPALFGLVVGVALVAFGMRQPYPLISFSLSAFVVATIASEFYRGTRARRQITGRGWLGSLTDLVGRNGRRYGGYVIHFGVVLFFVGATGKAFVQETKVSLARGQSATVGSYTLTSRGREARYVGNAMVVSAPLDVSRNGRPLGTLTPRRRVEPNAENPSTQVAIRSTLREDLYVILSATDGSRTDFKFLINPLMAWLWIGGLVVSLGAFIAVWPDHRRAARAAVAARRREETYAART